MLRVCQHNILSALWMTKEYQLLPCAEKFHSPDRINITANYLRNIQADIYCLCEVTLDTLKVLENAFPDYYRCFSSNQRGFWDEWLEDREWKPNGTCVFLKGSEFQDVLAEKLQMKDGSACCFVTCTHIKTSARILVVSIHLDNFEKKIAEEEEILYWITQRRSRVDLSRETQSLDIEIVCGDYNTTDVTKFTREGFQEYTPRDETTPLPQGMIDHSLVYRTSNKVSVKGIGKILHIPQDTSLSSKSIPANVLKISELTPEFISRLDPELVKKVVGNICETVQVNGSDHYATITELHLSTRQ